MPEACSEALEVLLRRVQLRPEIRHEIRKMHIDRSVELRASAYCLIDSVFDSRGLSVSSEEIITSNYHNKMVKYSPI